MDKIRIIGGVPLEGTIRISGAKNAALPLMCAALLTEKPFTLTNVPYLADIVTMTKLLMQHGVEMSMTDAHARQTMGGITLGRTLVLDASNIFNKTAPYEIVRKMRASVLVLGPLLARFGEARVSLPGGCAIGTRPIDLHLKALEQMGADIELDQGYIVAKAPKGLHGAEIYFNMVSVGATENIVMAATLAQGTTVLRNAACEPEIVDLVQCLRGMGANIHGEGTPTLTIHGVPTLGSVFHHVMADRIEAGSFLACVALAGGDVTLTHAPVDAMLPVLEKAREAGVVLHTPNHQTLRITSQGKLEPVDIITQPHPAFPTDMQAQFMAMMLLTSGTSTITETIFENRFMHVPELMRMGANIQLKDRLAIVKGVPKLNGAEVMATDLRASISLAIAALATPEETVIHRIYHLDRGYENLEAKLSACGADIVRMK
ncbi:MAG: UDP-N-acetylglucosamine 1-carboxyvinyltransferase [Alphaproteobacteria bacterium]|nr:MAG: UDP-N-acetylglucosamine 1-carboxyvinyltransferase [Alphaproteobacteria bacterium]